MGKTIKCSCPCCSFQALDSRGDYEICTIAGGKMAVKMIALQMKYLVGQIMSIRRYRLDTIFWIMVT